MPLVDTSSMKSTKTITRLILNLIFLTGTLSSVAQEDIKRQTVYSLVKQRQTTDWYKAPSRLWKYRCRPRES